MADPLNPVKVLRDRLTAEAAAMGLELVQFAISPAHDTQPDLIQAVFRVTETAVKTPEEREQDSFDSMFEQIVSGATKDEEIESIKKSIVDDEDKIEKARREALEMLKEDWEL